MAARSRLLPRAAIGLALLLTAGEPAVAQVIVVPPGSKVTVISRSGETTLIDGGTAGARVDLAAGAWSIKPHAPTADELAPYFPDDAQRSRIGGGATLRCGVTPRGKLQACAILSETPFGYGFGRAALQASRLYVVAPPHGDAPPTVEVPFTWTWRP